jgi:two-component system sensor histidine kinase UhpB
MTSSELGFDFLLIYFLYGLAFFSMGLVMLLESRRSPMLGEARLFIPLAIFGFTHGIHEWLEMVIALRPRLDLPVLAITDWVRLILLIVSFSFLLLFALRALIPQRRRLPYRLSYAGFGLLVVYLFLTTVVGFAQQETPHQWISHADALARYLLAVPAAMLAAVGLVQQSRLPRLNDRRALVLGLWLTALGFAVYGLTQLVVSPGEVYLSRYLNTTIFMDWFGIPVQLLRAVLAILVTIGMILAIQASEEVRQEQLARAQQARLEALEQIQRDLVEQETMRRELLRHTVIAQEDERARIARELHDETAQILTAMTFELATLRKVVPDKQPASGMLDRLQSFCRQMSQGIYRMVHDLRPAQLDDLGLVAALQYLVDEERRRVGLNIVLEIRGSIRRLDPLVETVLFRVAQEALTNIAHHARCETARMQLDYQPAQVTLLVNDLGVGFDLQRELEPPRGWGIAGMRERAESVGGRLKIVSVPGQGTRVEVVIPLQKEDFISLKEDARESDPLAFG